MSSSDEMMGKQITFTREKGIDPYALLTKPCKFSDCKGNGYATGSVDTCDACTYHADSYDAGN